MEQGIPVQIEEDDDEEIGPSLPQQEDRKPTAETLQHIQELQEKAEGAGAKKERQKWMTMMPSDAISSAFATGRPRRFANIPAGCKVNEDERCEV